MANNRQSPRRTSPLTDRRATPNGRAIGVVSQDTHAQHPAGAPLPSSAMSVAIGRLTEAIEVAEQTMSNLVERLGPLKPNPLAAAGGETSPSEPFSGGSQAVQRIDVLAERVRGINAAMVNELNLLEV